MARASGCARMRPDRRLGAGDDARLRAAEQLVGREAHDVGARRDALACGRLAGEHRRERILAALDDTRPEVVDQQEVPRLRERRELGQRDLLGEPDGAEVGRVHPHQGGRVRADRALVVGDARAVGGPDLDQPGAGRREDLGDPERAADLDQLTAGDHDLAPVRGGREGEQHGGGVVVHGHRRGGARQLANERLHVGLAAAARAGAEVVLEVRVSARRAVDRLERLEGERRTTEVGVDHDTRRVDHRAE